MMRNFTLLILTFFTLSLSAQNSINLSINHKVGSDNLEYNTEFTIPSGDKVKLTRCEYYISNISLVHDGGVSTVLDDVWALADAFDQEIYELGEYDIEEVESITFSIGVESPENNADPSLWGFGHPLAPQNPSMHWGWSAGYRFLAMEGNSGANQASFTFQVHALGNNNYHSQTVDLNESALGGVINIVLDANYLESFYQVSTSNGGITHGESGDSMDMLNNFRDDVFSAGVLVGINELLSDNVSIQIIPNPSTGGENSHLLIEMDYAKKYNLEIVDLSGKLIFSDQVSNTMNLPIVESGMYVINISDDKGNTLSEKWIVK